MQQENLKISQETTNLHILTISCASQDSELENQLKKSNDSLLWSVISKKKKNVVKNFLNDSFPVPSSNSSRRSHSDSISTAEISRCDSPTNQKNCFRKSRFAESIYEPIELEANNAQSNMHLELASPMLPKNANFLDDEDQMEEEYNCFNITRVSNTPENFSSEKNISNSSKSFKRSNTVHISENSSSKQNISVSPKNFAIKTKTEMTTPKSTPITKAQQAPKPIKLYLKADGKKSGLVMFNIARFQQMIDTKISVQTYNKFLILVQKMLDKYESNEETFKTSHGESLAASILLLAGSKVGISKTDFLDALKPWNKKMFTKVEMIKKNACYKQWKKIFATIVA